MTSPRTDREQKERERIKELARKGRIVTRGPGGVLDDFWEMSRPQDPEGLARRYFVEERRQGR